MPVENVLNISRLNPLRFFSDKLISDKSFTACYTPYDFTNIQFHSYGTGRIDIIAEIVDEKNKVISNLSVYHEVLNVSYNFYSIELSFTGLEGIHYLRIRHRAVGEFSYKTSWSNRICVNRGNLSLCLIEYYNTYNTQNINFNRVRKFSLRVNGGFGIHAYNPKSIDTIHQNQATDYELLHSDPFETRTLTVGGKRGIYDDFHSIINRVFSCDRTYINGVQYSKFDEATWEVSSQEDYPFRTWRIELIETGDNSESTVDFIFRLEWVDYVCAQTDKITTVESPAIRFTDSAVTFTGQVLLVSIISGIYTIDTVGTVRLLRSEKVQIIRYDSRGIMYLAGSMLMRLNLDATWTYVVLPGFINNTNIYNDMKADPDGGFWILANNDRIYYREPGKSDDAFHVISFYNPRSICFSSYGTFVGNDYDIYLYGDNVFTKVGTPGVVNKIEVADNGLVYACTNTGIYLVERTSLIQLNSIAAYDIINYEGYTYFASANIYRLVGDTELYQLSMGASPLPTNFFKVYRDGLYAMGMAIYRIDSPTIATLIPNENINISTAVEIDSGQMYVFGDNYLGRPIRAITMERKLTGSSYGQIVSLEKVIDGQTADGYPRSYSILEQFETYQAISNTQLSFLDSQSYILRRDSFFRYLTNIEGDFDILNESIIPGDCQPDQVPRFRTSVQLVRFNDNIPTVSIQVRSYINEYQVPFSVLNNPEDIEYSIPTNGLLYLTRPDTNDAMESYIDIIQDRSGKVIRIYIEKPEVIFEFSVQPEVNVPYYESSYDVSIVSTRNGAPTSYTVEYESDWITSIDYYDNYLTINFSENEAEQERTATLNILQILSGDIISSNIRQYGHTIILVEDANKLDDSFVVSAKGQDGLVYFGSDTSGIWVAAIDSTVKPTNIISGSVLCFGTDYEGTLYAGTTTGIYVLDNTSQWQPVLTDTASISVNAIGMGSDNTLVACCSDGLRFYNNNTQTFELVPNTSGTNFSTVNVCANDSMVLGTASGTLWFYNGQDMSTQSMDTLYKSIIYNDTVYATGLSGLYSISNDGTLAAINSDRGYNDLIIYNNKLYASANDGIYIYDLETKQFNASNITTGQFYGFGISQDNILFAASSQGIWFEDPQSGDFFVSNKDTVNVKTIATSGRGITYFAGIGVYKRGMGIYDIYAIPNEVEFMAIDSAKQAQIIATVDGVLVPYSADTSTVPSWLNINIVDNTVTFTADNNTGAFRYSEVKFYINENPDYTVSVHVSQHSDLPLEALTWDTEPLTWDGVPLTWDGGQGSNVTQVLYNGDNVTVDGNNIVIK